jgi:hypothetical protein
VEAVLKAVTAVPWAVVVLVALTVLLLGFTIAMVRSANSNMTVRFWKIEIRRGPRDPDPPACQAPPKRQLRSVDTLPSAPDPPAEPDEDQPHLTAQ